MHTPDLKTQSSTSAPAKHQTIVQALHQTAQPLTVLQGVLELVLIEPKTIQEYRETIETALLQTKRIIDGLNQIRKLTKTESLQGQGAGKAAGHV